MDPTVDEVQQFLNSIGGAQGLGAIGIATCIVHGLTLLLRSERFRFLGKSYPLAVFALSIASNVMALKITGLSWGAALLHGNTAALIQALITGKVPKPNPEPSETKP